MAFTSTTIQPVTKHNSHKVSGNEVAASLLLGILLTAYAAKNSKKALRKAKRKLLLTALKMKLSKKANNELATNTIIWILLAVAIIALLIVAPIAALVLAIIGLILYLTGTIHF
jgi:hypothetical protein